MKTADRISPIKTCSRTDPERQKAAEYVMSLSEAKMLALVPEQAGLANTACPNCKGGRPNLANWKWTPQSPHQIRCKDCGELYPNNPQYPDETSVAVEAPDGVHRYPYHHPPGNVRLFFRAKADYSAREYISDACQGLAELYWTTEDERYARRGTLILIRCAEVYPGYAYHYQYPGRETRFAPHTQNRIGGVPPYRTTRWTGWAYADISRELLRAYDLLRFWPGFEGMAGGRARERVEDDLLGAMVRFVIGFEEQYSNMSPEMWEDIIYAGRVLSRSEWIQEVLIRLDTFVSKRFLYDGHWMETSPSYCSQTLGHLKRVVDELEGYEPSKNAPEGMAAFMHKSLMKTTATLAACMAGHDNIRLPSGSSPTINDTWAQYGILKPRKCTESILMPGLGLAVLGGGKNENQIYAWLNFTSGVHHKHVDALSVGLFAFNNELLRDLGYTHSIGRTWANAMMSHNTVVVNGLNGHPDPEHRGHRLRVFATDRKGFHLAEAESDATYPDITRRFRRTLLLVGADSRDAYLIDIFQVSGGRQHDYLLHGSAAEDSTAKVAGAALTPYGGTLMNSGTNFVYPNFETPRAGDFGAGKGGDFGFIRRLCAGPAEQNVTVDLRLCSNPRLGVRTHLLCAPGTTIYLGEAPRIRQAEGQGHLFHTFQAPVFCARRKGQDLNSVFIAVHEPLNGATKVQKVAAEPVRGGVFLTVDRGRGGRDYLTMAFDEPISITKKTPEGVLEFDGAYGLARASRGEVHLVGGKRLTLGNMQTTGVPGWQGLIRKVHRTSGQGSLGYFEVAEPVDPANPAAALIVKFPDATVRAYTIAQVEARNGRTRLYVVEDPGYAVIGKRIELRTYPQRTIQGMRVQYGLPGVAHAFSA